MGGGGGAGISRDLNMLLYYYNIAFDRYIIRLSKQNMGFVNALNSVL